VEKRCRSEAFELQGLRFAAAGGSRGGSSRIFREPAGRVRGHPSGAAYQSERHDTEGQGEAMKAPRPSALLALLFAWVCVPAACYSEGGLVGADCRSGLSECGGECVDLSSDRENFGAC